VQRVFAAFSVDSFYFSDFHETYQCLAQRRYIEIGLRSFWSSDTASMGKKSFTPLSEVRLSRSQFLLNLHLLDRGSVVVKALLY
jgi:hypothetical protein